MEVWIILVRALYEGNDRLARYLGEKNVKVVFVFNQNFQNKFKK